MRSRERDENGYACAPFQLENGREVPSPPFTLPGCAQIERDGEIELGREPGIAREPGVDSCRGSQIGKPAA